jgi:5-methylcytosine-specific restriction enzyme subunit McrC
VTVLDLRELAAPAEWPLTQAQGRALAASGIVEAAPSNYDDGRWLVRATGRVGVARIGDLEVRIQPKVRIDRLLFMLGYALNPAGWREELVGLAEVDDLVPALAHALWRQSERAVTQGLLQGYRVHEETSPVLRGRLRDADQLRRHRGLPLPLEIQYDEFTVDIAENQLLRAATERLLRLPRVDGATRRRLRHLLTRFLDVSPLVRGRDLPQWTPTRLNARYHTALHLAELVLRGTALQHQAGAVSVNGFLLDMPRLFEDFVTVALREALSPFGGVAKTQDRHHLDLAAAVDLRPDLVWHREGEPIAVVDAKYKAEKSNSFPNADLYQMLAYCTVLRLPIGHLVYAKGNEDATRHAVRNADVEIRCHALDLEQPPALLLRQIAHIAEGLAAAADACPAGDG